MRKLMPLLLVAALLLAACGRGSGGTQAPPAPEPGPTIPDPAPSDPAQPLPAQPEPAGGFSLVVAQGGDIVSLDLHAANDQPSSRVNRQIYETLVDQDENLEIKPGLATEWHQIDELTWEFKLRPNVKFHNGETLKASDVKFTFDRLRDPATAAPGAFILGPVEEVTVVDDLTVRIRTASPFGPLLAHLAHPTTGIMSEKAVTEAGADYGERPVGTGPFEFVSRTTGSHVDLKRFEDYWGEKAGADTLRFRAIPEGASRALELETGGVDIAYALEPQDYERLKGQNTVQLLRSPTLSTNYIGFNLQKAPFDKVEVRQAINHAINVDEIIEHVLLNVGVKATGPIASLVWGANPNLAGYDYDVEKARELLAQAGYADGFATTIWTNDNPVRMRIAEVVQSQLKEIGITVEVQVVEWTAYLQDTAAGKHDMFILGWNTVTGDADYGLYATFHSSQHGSSGNRTFYTNPEVDALLDIGRNTGDQDERFRAYQQAQELITRDAPWLFLNVTEEVNGLARGISGFVPHPAGHHRLAPVQKQ